jgi:hypothetical protein
MATDISEKESVTQEPAPAKTSAKRATSKKRVAKNSKSKKSAAKKKVAKKRVSKKPVAAKKSVAKKSVAKKAAPKKRKAKKQPASTKINKAQSIRDAAKELGKKARPRDIIAALAAKRISVSSPQVSTTLKAAGMRRGRRRRKVVTAIASKQHAGNGQGLDISELVKVKILADQLGGTEKLKEAVAALERLL